MNPNLVIFLKTAVKWIAAIGLLVGAVYLVKTYWAIDLEKIGAYVMYGFFGLIMAFMMVLIIGVTFKSIWVGIMRRTGNITLCCLDANNEGVHIVGNHYFSGGETSDGYYAYHHYFIRFSDGKMFLSRKIKDESNLDESLRHLQEQTKLRLAPDRSKAISVGGNTHDDLPTHRVINLPEGELHIDGFENWFDEGFRISLMEGTRIKWRNRL
jgi:hypothetical protein